MEKGKGEQAKARQRKVRKLKKKKTHMKIGNMQLTKAFGTTPVAGLLAGLLCFAGSGLTALGAEAFTVDSSQSRVAISGSVLGNSFDAQGAGSLETHYAGTLVAEVGNDAIRFPGQSQVVALDSGSWEPLPNGNAGSATANYGVAASSFFTEGVAAARDMQLDVTSGALALVNGKFDTQGITVSIPPGAPTTLAYRVQGAIDTAGALALAGVGAGGQMAQGSLMTVGRQQIMTIPINYRFVFSLVSKNDTIVNLTGQVVATRSL